MRIVSMVPSWTETLIAAGGYVVGRTRFCIHPAERVKNIPAVGGTKNWDIAKVKALRPDLVLLDQEENTKEMGQYQETPLLATHVRSVQDLPGELMKIRAATGLEKLADFSRRFERVSIPKPVSPRELPGVIEWIREPGKKIDKVVYIIWRNPWMAVSSDTFIGSMLNLFLAPELVLKSEKKYPEIILEHFNTQTTLLLFSSEPFPFAKQRSLMAQMPYPSALVDGEAWSWFGLRSLHFLERARG